MEDWWHKKTLKVVPLYSSKSSKEPHFSKYKKRVSQDYEIDLYATPYTHDQAAFSIQHNHTHGLYKACDLVSLSKIFISDS